MLEEGRLTTKMGGVEAACSRVIDRGVERLLTVLAGSQDWIRANRASNHRGAPSKRQHQRQRCPIGVAVDHCSPAGSHAMERGLNARTNQRQSHTGSESRHLR